MHVKVLRGLLNFSWLAMVIFALTSCDHDRNKPGYTFYPDMEESQAYETYSANPNFIDGKTNQLPVTNTISRNHIPYRFVKNDSSLLAAGRELENPFSGNDSVFVEGKRLYTIYCSSCHGDKGDGKGLLFTSDKYPFPPASLLSDKVRQRPDGELFHIISVGYGIMGAHQNLVTENERWMIIEYIRQEFK